MAASWVAVVAMTMAMSMASATAAEQPAAQADEQPPPAETPLPAPTPVATPDVRASFAEGSTHGLVDAANESTYAWGGGGFAGGLLLPPVGCLGVMIGANVVEPRLPEDADDGQEGNEAYLSGYRLAYTNELKARRGRAAIVGGTAGMTITLLVITLFGQDLGLVEDSSGAIQPGLGFGARF